MMIERKYRCDLCRDYHELGDHGFVPVRFGSGDKIEKETNSHHAEHHLCARCISSVHDLWEDCFNKQCSICDAPSGMSDHCTQCGGGERK